MRIQDIFNSRSVALNRTEVVSNRDPYMGLAFFPEAKKVGLDIGWVKIHKGLGIALKPSNFDALSTIRPREGFNITKNEMPFFRESMQVRERDMMDIQRVIDTNDPYVNDILSHIYNDTNELLDGADIIAELMRMQLLSANGGSMGITIKQADNTIYLYDYDEDGSWKAKHYIELKDTATWDKPETASPLDDFEKAVDVLSDNGVNATYALMNSATFKMLRQNKQIKDSIITSTGNQVGFVNKNTVMQVLEDNTNLQFIIYDKKYIDYDGNEQKFYPDGYVTIIGDGDLGTTWYGTTPEERTLIGDSKVDVTVLDNGVAVAVKTEYGPPVMVSTTASQIVLPSFEGMDSIVVMKVVA